MNYLLLSTGKPSKHLIEAIERRKHTWEHQKPDNLYLYVSEHENGFDRLYNGSADLEKPVRLKAKDYDAVISRIGSGVDYGATILLHLTENIGIYCPQTPEGILTARDKMRTTQKLSSSGLKVPRTVMAKHPIHAEFLTEKIGGLPAIAKLIQGSQGKGVMILNDATQTNTSLESFHKVEVDLVLQQFIESGAKDIRAIVVGDEVVVAMERSGKKDFRANISQGGSGRMVELSQADKDICIKASKAVGLQFSGVDILKSADGTTYVIEVNSNPGEKIISITGVNYFDKLIEFTEKKQKSTSSNNSTLQNSTTPLKQEFQWTSMREPLKTGVL